MTKYHIVLSVTAASKLAASKAAAEVLAGWGNEDEGFDDIITDFKANNDSIVTLEASERPEATTEPVEG